MAYMKKDGSGPYPNKAGEYCSNHMPNSPPRLSFDEDPAEAAQHQREWLAKMRVGRPHACKAGTSAEMARMGYVGLYLKEDSSSPLPDGATEIETPEELKEPTQ